MAELYLIQFLIGGDWCPGSQIGQKKGFKLGSVRVKTVSKILICASVRFNAEFQFAVWFGKVLGF